MIKQWSPKVLEEGSEQELDAECKGYMDRWFKVMFYFTSILKRPELANRIVFVSDDKFSLPSRQILASLGLTPSREIPELLDHTHVGRKAVPDILKKTLTRLLSSEKGRCRNMYKRAKLISDRHFGLAVEEG